jgi:hypothetical protein
MIAHATDILLDFRRPGCQFARYSGSVLFVDASGHPSSRRQHMLAISHRRSPSGRAVRATPRLSLGHPGFAEYPARCVRSVGSTRLPISYPNSGADSNHHVVERPRPQRSGGRIDTNGDAQRRGLRDIPFRLTTVARPPRTASGAPRGRSHQRRGNPADSLPSWRGQYPYRKT